MKADVPCATDATLRHARACHSAVERYAGTIDVPLGASREHDCRAVARSFAAGDVDVVVTSNVRRAMKAFARTGLRDRRLQADGVYLTLKPLKTFLRQREAARRGLRAKPGAHGPGEAWP